MSGSVDSVDDDVPRCDKLTGVDCPGQRVDHELTTETSALMTGVQCQLGEEDRRDVRRQRSRGTRGQSVTVDQVRCEREVTDYNVVTFMPDEGASGRLHLRSSRRIAKPGIEAFVSAAE